MLSMQAGNGAKRLRCQPINFEIDAIAFAVILAALFSTITSNSVHAACNTSDRNVFSNCADEMKSGVKGSLTGTNAADKAQNVGEATRNCFDCAKEYVSEKIKSFKVPDQKK